MRCIYQLRLCLQYFSIGERWFQMVEGKGSVHGGNDDGLWGNSALGSGNQGYEMNAGIYLDQERISSIWNFSYIVIVT